MSARPDPERATLERRRLLEEIEDLVRAGDRLADALMAEHRWVDRPQTEQDALDHWRQTRGPR